MSNTNGVAYRDKSMNGVITISDGGGTTISNGTITANTLKINELTTNTIKSTTPSATVNAYIANTGNVNIGGSTSTLKLSNTIEPASVSPVNLFSTATNIVVGNESGTTKVGKYEFIGDDIVGMTNNDTTRLFNNLTTGELNIAPSLTTGTCTIGSTTSSNTVGKFNFVADDITSVSPTDPVSLFNTTTADITIGETVADANTITIGTKKVNIGRFTFNNYLLDFDTPSQFVACFDFSEECYFGDYATYTGLGTHSDRIDVGHFQNEEQEVRIGNYRNINNVGKYILIGDEILSDANDTATSLFSNITTGSLEIGTGLTTGALTLGNATNTNTVGKFNLIGDDITSSAVSSATTLMSNITTGSVKLGAGITTGFTNIGESLTTGFLNLGSSASVANTGGVRIWKPLYLLYTSLSSLASNQVGYFITGTGAVNQVTTTVTTIRTITLPVGVWLVKCRARVNGIGCQFVKLYIAAANNATNVNNEYIISGSGTNETAGQFVQIFTVASGTLTRYMTMSADATYTLTNPTFEALRIT